MFLPLFTNSRRVCNVNTSSVRLAWGRTVDKVWWNFYRSWRLYFWWRIGDRGDFFWFGEEIFWVIDSLEDIHRDKIVVLEIHHDSEGWKFGKPRERKDQRTDVVHGRNGSGENSSRSMKIIGENAKTWNFNPFKLTQSDLCKIL